MDSKTDFACVDNSLVKDYIEHMSELRQYLKRRIATVGAQLKELQREYDELVAAQSALPAIAQSSDDSAPSFFHVNLKPAHDLELTIKDRVLRSLYTRPEGGTANDIIAFIKEDFGDSIERTSLSPQLSRLREEGKILRIRMGYKLAKDERERLRSELESIKK